MTSRTWSPRLARLAAAEVRRWRGPLQSGTVSAEGSCGHVVARRLCAWQHDEPATYKTFPCVCLRTW